MQALEWNAGKVRVLDQRRLPWDISYREFETAEALASAIRTGTLNGSGTLGAAVLYAAALAAHHSEASSPASLRDEITLAAGLVQQAHSPTLLTRWALRDLLARVPNTDAATMKTQFVEAAQQIVQERVELNKRLAVHGSMLIKDGDTVLHHGSSGSLAHVEYGTALGAIRAAHEDGKKIQVLLTESRPLLDGARLCAWELKQHGVPFTLVTEGGAAYEMQRGKIRLCLVDAAHINMNGWVTGAPGTYMLAVVAQENWLPFYVVAPTTVINPEMSDSEVPPMENRDTAEITTPHDCPLIPSDVPVRNLAFDHTPPTYISGIVTEHGMVRPPYLENFKKVMN